MRKSSNGMQRKMAPSTAPHPDFQKGVFKIGREERKAATVDGVSWWIGVPRGPKWNELVTELTAKSTQQTDQKDAISAKDLVS